MTYQVGSLQIEELLAESRLPRPFASAIRRRALA